MTLNVKGGRPIVAGSRIDKGGKMANKAKAKAPDRPTRQPMIRVCGRWQKPGYEADKSEQDAWNLRCKNRNWDPKTGKPKVDKTAPAAKK